MLSVWMFSSDLMHFLSEVETDQSSTESEDGGGGIVDLGIEVCMGINQPGK